MGPRRGIVARGFSRSTLVGVVALVMIVIASGSFNRTHVRLRREGCFGACPDYDVEIDGDGLVTYHGWAFVIAHGLRQARVSPAAVHALVDRLGRAGVWTMPAPASAAGPADVLTVVSGLRVRTIRAPSPEPPALAELTDAVDGLSGDRRWVGSQPVAPAPPPAH